MSQNWVKHTINLVYGSELDMKFKKSTNKSAMVRFTFTRANELYCEAEVLRDENKELRQNIAKLQARLSGDRTNEDVIREFVLDPTQSVFEVEEE